MDNSTQFGERLKERRKSALVLAFNAAIALSLLKFSSTKLTIAQSVPFRGSFAGGCLLAVSCDYRIMADGFVIGTNETLLGITAPSWFQNTLINTVGYRQAELMLSLGLLLPSKYALEIGLVDSVVPQNEVLDGAKIELKKWLAIPANARYLTKINLRGPTLEKLRKEIADDTKKFVEFIGKESTQKIISGYLKKLSEKSKK